MTTLKIEYDIKSRRAQLSSDDSGAAWSDIRQACEDRSTEVEEKGPAAFSMPWWAFLNSRSAINFYVQRHKVSVVFDAEARLYLQQSREHEKNYEASASAPPVDIAELTGRLSARGFTRLLTTPQIKNVSRLASMASGATFSVPGAGKTTEALAYYFYKRAENNRLLIVCPKNAFAVWEEQIKECVPGYKGLIVRLVGGEKNIQYLLTKDPAVCLITYHQLPIVISYVAAYLTSNPCFMYVDESHRMKRGTDGVWASAVLSIAHLAEHKLVLSGTPMPQSILDLVPQFKFLFPEVPVDEDNIENLVKPIYVRTTKNELNIPSVDRRAIEVPLNSEQRYVYDLLRSEIARQANKALNLRQRMQYRQIGRSAMRLLQFVSNPALLLSSGVISEELLSDVLASGDSPKISIACTRARELAARGKKTIIWSSFVKNVELISSRLADLGADFIHGGVETGSEEEEDTRERKILRFHEDSKAYVLVGNPAACGESISLHKVCHNAIYIDRTFNVAQYLQSEDRIHRLGLKPDQKTIVEILISPETIDETVDTRLRLKVRKMSEVLEDQHLHIDPVKYDLEDEELDDDDFAALVEHLNEGVRES